MTIAQIHDQQFQNYQIRKMYSNEVAAFGNAETKLKQLQLKLRETEQHKSSLQRENGTINYELEQLSGNIPPRMAAKLEKLFNQLAVETFNSFEDHIRLREKHAASMIKTID